MSFRKITPLLAILAASLFLAACSTASAATQTTSENGIPSSDIPQVAFIAESRLVPSQSVDLSFAAAGEVAEILVEEGDPVKAGDVLARLSGREPLESAVAAAEAELVNARLAEKELMDNYGISQAAALNAVAAANQALRDAQYQLDNYTIPTTLQGITPMEAVQVTNAALERARADFEPYKYRSSSDPVREDLREALDEAQSDYNAATRWLNYEVAVAGAQAELDKAQQDLQNLSNGPDPDALQAAQVRINAAEAALKSARSALENLELKAPIDGLLVRQDLIPGEQVSPAQPVITLADFSTWYVETDDLTELEVVDVQVGQPVTILPDALPGVEMRGIVAKIDNISEEKRGSVTYTVTIRLEDPDPRLRWGMTVAVNFE